MLRAFVSYRFNEKGESIAKHVKDLLSALDVESLDGQSLSPGESLTAQIQDRIRSCHILFMTIAVGENSVWVGTEAGFAAGLNIPVVIVTDSPGANLGMFQPDVYIDISKPGFSASAALISEINTVRAKILESQKDNRGNLGEFKNQGFLQVLVKEFRLGQPNGRRTLEVRVNEDMEFVRRSRQKEILTEEVQTRENSAAELERLSADIQRSLAGSVLEQVECRHWPLRFANGGVLPIIESEGKQFFCLFYRERRPTGWNIANGASDNLEEILDPSRVIHREFGEELLVIDEQARVIRAHEPGPHSKTVGYQIKSIHHWDQKFLNRQYGRFKLRGFSRNEIQWINGPDCLTTIVDLQQVKIEGFLSITTEDNAIEIDRIAYLRLPPGFVCLDGEISGSRPLGRVIGLFDCKSLLEKRREKTLVPELLFFEGERRDPSRLQEIVDEYREKIGATKSSQRSFPLCPITLSVLTRVRECLDSGLITLPSI